MTLEEQFAATLAISNTHLFFIRKTLELPGLASWSKRAPSLNEIADGSASVDESNSNREALVYGRLAGAYRIGDRETLLQAKTLNKSSFPWAVDIASDLIGMLPAMTFNQLNIPGPPFEAHSIGRETRV